MANKYHGSPSNPSKQTGGEGGAQKAQGSGGPGGESRTGPNRSGGSPTTGKRGPFYVRKQGI